MNCYARMMSFAVAMLLVGGIAAVEAEARKPQAPGLTTCKLESQSDPVETGSITLELRFSSSGSFDCDTIHVVLIENHNLGYAGDTVWEIAAELGKEYSLQFAGIVPENDTCGMSVKLGCGDVWDYAEWYAVSKDEAVVIFDRDLRKDLKYRAPSHRPAGKRTGRVIPGEFPLYDSVYGLGDTPSAILNPKGTMSRGKTPEASNLPKRIRTIEDLRELEKSPLVGKPKETHKIGDTFYVRHEGEYTFEARGPIYDVDAHMKARIDSLNAIRPTEWPAGVVLDLRDPRDYDYAKRVVDSLSEMDRQGVFTAVVDESTFESLRQHGIRVRPRSRESQNKTDSPDSKSVDSKGESGRGPNRSHM